MNILDEGKKVFDLEIEALLQLRNLLDNTFVEVVNRIIQCKGKIIVTGIGKPGHIGKKIASTFSSLGTPSFFLHPAEAMHGDLGMIDSQDLVIAISNSGESEEITRIIPNIKKIGAYLIAITANDNSTLSRYSDLVQIIPKVTEACHLGIAPTSSSTIELVYGDALAVVCSIAYGYNEVNFGLFHPAGSIGKKLLITVGDVMKIEDENSVVFDNVKLKDAIIELGKKGLGIVTICSMQHEILGVFTDGDLRRQLEKGADIYSLEVKDIMTTKPIAFSRNQLAVDALNILRNNNIASAPVIDENKKIVGTIKLQDILKVGISI